MLFIHVSMIENQCSMIHSVKAIQSNFDFFQIKKNLKFSLKLWFDNSNECWMKVQIHEFQNFVSRLMWSLWVQI